MQQKVECTESTWSSCIKAGSILGLSRDGLGVSLRFLPVSLSSAKDTFFSFLGVDGGDDGELQVGPYEIAAMVLFFKIVLFLSSPFFVPPFNCFSDLSFVCSSCASFSSKAGLDGRQEDEFLLNNSFSSSIKSLCEGRLRFRKSPLTTSNPFTDDVRRFFDELSSSIGWDFIDLSGDSGERLILFSADE